MKFYDKVLELAKSKGLTSANQITNKCNIAAQTWYNFRNSGKLSDTTKARLAEGLGISVGELNAMASEALAEELQENNEVRPGEPRREAAPKPEPKAEESVAVVMADAEAKLEEACAEATRYLPKEEVESDYFKEAKKKAINTAMELLQKVACEQMCEDIEDDFQKTIKDFITSRDIDLLKKVQSDILPAWIRAEEELSKYDE